MKSFKLIVIQSIAGLLFFIMTILAAFAPGNEELENKHECTTSDYKQSQAIGAWDILQRLLKESEE